MTRDDIITGVNKILVEEFELDREKLLPDTSIRELGLDSLDYFDMIILLESDFNFKLKDRSVIEKIVTVGDIYDFIEKLVRENKNLA